MNRYLLFLFFSTFVFSNAQVQDTPPVAAKRQVQTVETQPSFPGGMQVLYKKIVDAINQDSINTAQNTAARLYFDVQPNGKISDLKVEGYNDSFNKEILRVMKSIKTKWIPATSNGKPVKHKFLMPFKFKFAD